MSIPENEATSDERYRYYLHTVNAIAASFGEKGQAKNEETRAILEGSLDLAAQMGAIETLIVIGHALGTTPSVRLTAYTHKTDAHPLFGHLIDLAKTYPIENGIPIDQLSHDTLEALAPDAPKNTLGLTFSIPLPRRSRLHTNTHYLQIAVYPNHNDSTDKTSEIVTVSCISTEESTMVKPTESVENQQLHIYHTHRHCFITEKPDTQKRSPLSLHRKKKNKGSFLAERKKEIQDAIADVTPPDVAKIIEQNLEITSNNFDD